MSLVVISEKSSQSLDSFHALRDEKNGVPAKNEVLCGVEYRRFVSWQCKGGV